MNKNRISTGIKGLDKISNGGLIAEHFYLVRGGPGTGKTTLGLHFLTEGSQKGEDTLFITLTEPAEKIKNNAQSFDFNITNIEFLDLNPNSNFIKDNKDYDIIPSSQMEQKPLIDKIIKNIKKNKPDRIFIDGITQLKYISSDKFKFRKQVLSFIQFAMDYNITILLTSEASKNNPDDDLQYLVDGVINLGYGQSFHFINISKLRGIKVHKGKHSMKFTSQGIKVFPKLETKDENKNITLEKISSGVPEIDKLLYGGIETGTSTFITGPSGVGKTTLGMQFMKEAARNGINSVIYTFEESKNALLKRSEKINIPLKKMVKQNNLLINKINPVKQTPEEFSNKLCQDINNKDISIIMIDSIAGYFLLYKNENRQNMIRRLHTLIEHLKNKGITVLLINELKNITGGDFKVTENGTSYLSDNIVFLRYLEINGKLQKAIGVLKKRMSNFENEMRQFEITENGIKVGKPLKNLRGILTGNPEIIEGGEE